MEPLRSKPVCRHVAELLLLTLAFASTLFAQQRTTPRPHPRTAGLTGALQGKTASDQALNDAGTQELQRRLETRNLAVSSGNPQLVVAATKRVVALALQRVGGLRMLVGFYPQAVELYRESLALEDSQQVRLNLANAAMASGEADEAITQVTKLLEADPDSDRLWRMSGKAYLAKQNYPAAVESLNRALALRKDLNVQYELASAYLRAGDKPHAEALFQQIVKENGDRAVWHLLFGGAYREARMGEDAIREFKRTIAMDNNAKRVHLYLSLTLLEENGWAPSEESIRELREAVRQDPKDFYANLYLGLGESQTDRLVESNKHLNVAAQLDPNVAEIWLYLGLNAFKQNNLEDAKKYLLKAVELTGDNEAQGSYEIRRGYIALGRIEYIAGNTELAKKYSDKVKELKSKAMADQAESIAEITGGMGSASVIPHSKLPDKNALTDAAQVDAAARLDSNALAKTSLSVADQEKVKTLEQNLRDILSNCYNDWGTADARQGMYALALDHFKEAEHWNNATPGLMRNIGLAALKQGDLPEAVRVLRIAAEATPSDTLVQARLAMALFDTDQYAEDLKHFDAVGEAIYSDQAMTYAWAYSLVRVGGQQKKSIDVLNHVMLFPLTADTLLSVGDLYAVVEDYEHAIVAYRRALDQEPSTAGAHYKMGAALIRLSRLDEAITALRTELKSTPNNVDAKYNLAYALLETSQKEQALQILRELLASSPNHPQARYLLGKALLESGQLEESVQNLEVAAKLDPESDYVHYQLQLAYRRSGRIEDADREAKIYKGIKTRKRESVVIPMPERKHQ